MWGHPVQTRRGFLSINLYRICSTIRLVLSLAFAMNRVIPLCLMEAGGDIWKGFP
jgi:hypothetical protein